MVAKASIIKNYAKADAAGKVDIICKNYSNFIGIVDGYTEGLCYMIENEKAFNSKQIKPDTGLLSGHFGAGNRLCWIMPGRRGRVSGICKCNWTLCGRS